VHEIAHFTYQFVHNRITGVKYVLSEVFIIQSVVLTLLFHLLLPAAWSSG